MLEQELARQQEALLSQHRAAACDLEEDEQKLTSVQSELQTSRTGDRKLLRQLLKQPIRRQCYIHTHTYCISIYCVCVCV